MSLTTAYLESQACTELRAAFIKTITAKDAEIKALQFQLFQMSREAHAERCRAENLRAELESVADDGLKARLVRALPIHFSADGRSCELAGQTYTLCTAEGHAT